MAVLSEDEIKSIELLKGIPASEALALLAQCSIRELAAGQLLLAPERENRHMYLVLSGSLSVHFESPKAPEIRKITAGSSVGELSVIDHGYPSAYVIANEPSRVLALEQQDLWTLVDRHGRIARNLLVHFAQWLISNAQHIVEHHRKIDELEGFARVDGLTGLYNRRWLDEALVRFLNRADQEHRPLALMLLDVDYFKKYNDVHGHLGGDRALVALAKVLTEELRPGDQAARYGGEEFSILLPETSLEDAINVAERLRISAATKTFHIPEIDDLPKITISIGIAEHRPGDTPEGLIERADHKLYQAKRKGRNRICY